MPFEAAGKVEFQEHHEHLCGMQAGVLDDLVGRDRCRPERLDDAGAILLAGRRRGGEVGWFLEPVRQGRRPAGA